MRVRRHDRWRSVAEYSTIFAFLPWVSLILALLNGVLKLICIFVSPLCPFHVEIRPSLSQGFC